MNRTTLLARLLVSTLFLVCVAETQAKKVPRLGWLSVQHGPRIHPAFRQAIRELGWYDGQNIDVVARFAKERYDQLPKLAAELVQLDVDVIVAADSPVIPAAKNATGTIPIVMAVVSDPIALGYVASLARPGGNITGLSNNMHPLNGKRLQILKEAVPTVSRVAMLGPSKYRGWQDLRTISQTLGLELKRLAADNAAELERSLKSILRERISGLVVIPSPETNFQRSQIVEFASHNQLPAVYPLTIYVSDGGLMSYGPDLAAMLKRAAYYVDRILKGAKPSDLPVERPMAVEFAINLKAAEAIGIRIPPELLQRADHVIR